MCNSYQWFGWRIICWKHNKWVEVESISGNVILKNLGTAVCIFDGGMCMPVVLYQ
jgi:hypothetical protein